MYLGSPVKTLRDLSKINNNKVNQEKVMMQEKNETLSRNKLMHILGFVDID
jgi:hypothetical protein